MWNMKTVFIVLLFLFSSLYFPGRSIETSDDLTNPEVNVDDNYLVSSDDYSESKTPPSSRAFSVNPHGGSWIDLFEDNSDIDFGSSGNIIIERAIVKIQPPTELQVDANTAGLWHFNEGSGTTVSDASSNNNDGTIFGTETWVSGAFGNALEFDGSSTRVDIADSASLSITDSITLELWVKFTSLPFTGNVYPLIKKRVLTGRSE